MFALLTTVEDSHKNSNIDIKTSSQGNIECVAVCGLLRVSPLRAAASTSLSASERQANSVAYSSPTHTHINKHTCTHRQASETAQEEKKRAQTQERDRMVVATRRELKTMAFEAKLIS